MGNTPSPYFVQNLCPGSLNISRHRHRSILILGSFWLAFSFFVTSSYECNLRAYLLVTEYEPGIDSPEDVLYNDRAIWIPHGASTVTSLRLSNLEVHQKLYEKVIVNCNCVWGVHLVIFWQYLKTGRQYSLGKDRIATRETDLEVIETGS